jgi:DNA-directed RNA polymerase specialized sigma24 family protein
MADAGSVTTWITQLQAGNHDAAQPLWERYFPQLVRLARAKLQGVPRREADEEDVALSAFASFCRGAQEHRFPRLSDRDNLWPLLVVITARKASDRAVHVRGPKQGGGRVRGDSALMPSPSSSQTDAGFDQIVGTEPTPAFAAEVAEQFQRLLSLLDDDEQRSLVLLKLEGYTNQEIAGKLGCALRTVERALRLIRGIWKQELAS